MDNFLSQDELKELGLKHCGEDVWIGRHAVLYHPEKLSIGNHVRIDDFTVIIFIYHNTAVYTEEMQV